MEESRSLREEYPPMRETREIMKDLREQAQMTKSDVAKAIAEETGYRFTADMYRAIEGGMTKQTPAWVLVAYMKVMNVLPDTLFPYIGRMF